MAPAAPAGGGTAHPGARVAVFGDVGGHREQWFDRLVALGADPVTLELPDGLSVVQVGDLVHRGPDSAGCVDLAGRLWDANPGRVRLLVGNHEGHYLDGPCFGTVGGAALDRLDRTGADVLRRWRDQGRLVAAAAVDTGDGTGVLVTHAGLTAPVWDRLGLPGTAAEAAAALRDMWDLCPSQFWRAGRMLGEPHGTSAGPVWAEAGHELYASWRDTAAPFDQVHGHSSAYRWGRDEFDPAWVGQVATVDRRRRHVAVRLGGRTLWGVDPGLGRWGTEHWEPLVLAGHLADV